jgi:hypothetical protein
MDGINMYSQINLSHLYLSVTSQPEEYAHIVTSIFISAILYWFSIKYN